MFVGLRLFNNNHNCLVQLFELVMFVWCRDEFNACSQRNSVEGVEGMYLTISLMFVSLLFFL